MCSNESASATSFPRPLTAASEAIYLFTRRKQAKTEPGKGPSAARGARRREEGSARQGKSFRGPTCADETLRMTPVPGEEFPPTHGTLVTARCSPSLSHTCLFMNLLSLWASFLPFHIHTTSLCIRLTTLGPSIYSFLLCFSGAAASTRRASRTNRAG